ncbi:MAG: ABC transporter substrate-binding protein [Anaerolineales bacterium]|nr:ABC transporter substrate-binding protein [Anaerolineales bacterium]
MRRTSLLRLGGPLAILLALSACGGASASKDTYRIGILAQPSQGNVWGINALPTYWDLAVQSPMRLSLFGVSDQRFQLIPQVAADFASPLAQEGDVWVSTVKLREGIRWSDGEPLTAGDVAFTLNTSLRFGLTGGNWSVWADGDYLKSVEAPDDLTVKLVYSAKPGMASHEWGTLTATIACEHYWAPLVEEAAQGLADPDRPERGVEDPGWAAYLARRSEAAEKLFALADEDEPLAGAFLFSREEAGSFLELKANKQYFFSGVAFEGYENGAYRESKPKGYTFSAYGTPEGAQAFAYKSGPFAAKALYSVYGDLNAAVLALQNGEIDILLNPQGLPKGLAESVQDDPNLAVVQNESVAFRFLGFNTRREPMGDAAFRQAVATLIDREFLTDTILQGVAYPVYSFVPEANADWYKPDLPRWGFTPDGAPMTRAERMDKAVEILVAAGYSWSDGSIPVWDAESAAVRAAGTLVTPDGDKMATLELLSFSYSADPLRATFALWIAQWLNEFGIPIRVQPLGFNALFSRTIQQQDFDMFLLGNQAGLFPSYLRNFWHSREAAKGGWNAGGYSNRAFDQLSDQLLSCGSYTECKPIADQIQVLIATAVPWIPLFDTGIYEIYNRRVEFPYTQTYGGLQYLYGLPSVVALS